MTGPAEFALRWAWRYQAPWVAVLVAFGGLAVNLGIWRLTTRVAERELPERELEVLARLDPRLNV